MRNGSFGIFGPSLVRQPMAFALGIAVAAGLMGCLTASGAFGQQGLKGEYYKGTNFEEKVLTRMDPQIQFDWSTGTPAPSMPRSYYSIRWTGKLLAPVSGIYRFYAKVDDGIRVWVGNKKVVESWQLNNSGNYSGSVVLKAGQYYDFRVDYFNEPLGGVITLYWERPDAKTKVLGTPGEPIGAQYFAPKTPPPVLPPPTRKPVPVAAAVVPKKAAPPAKLKAIPTRPSRRPPAEVQVVVASPVPAPRPEAPPEPLLPISPGVPLVLPHVQFEQSSYLLRPESSEDLDKLVTVMKANPGWQLTIAGHTDNVGDPRLNQALSENRARVVASYLKQRGIADDRLTTKGYGGSRPVADNTNLSERGKNRRVEITVR